MFFLENGYTRRNYARDYWWIYRILFRMNGWKPIALKMMPMKYI